MDMQDRTEPTRTRRESSASRAVQTGATLGRFSVLSEIGSGGMGRIYEAYDPNLDRHIALKLLRDAGDHGRRRRLVREAQTLARLDHPNVVTVHEVGLEGEVVFVAMELLQGGTLKEWIAQHPIGSKTRFDEAVSALETYASVYGREHPQTGCALTSLGGLFISRNEPERAVEVLLRARASFEATLGAQHPVVPVVLNNLGTAYKAQGNLTLAIETLEQALELRREVDGPHHAGVAKTLFNLGSAQFEARRNEDAIASLRAGRAILAGTNSPNPVRLARYDLLIGTAQVNLGRFEDAEGTLEPLLEIFPIARGDAGRFARRTRLYLALAKLPSDVSRSRTLVRLAAEVTDTEDTEHSILQHLGWLLDAVERIGDEWGERRLTR